MNKKLCFLIATTVSLSSFSAGQCHLKDWDVVEKNSFPLSSVPGPGNQEERKDDLEDWDVVEKNSLPLSSVPGPGNQEERKESQAHKVLFSMLKELIEKHLPELLEPYLQKALMNRIRRADDLVTASGEPVFHGNVTVSSALLKKLTMNGFDLSKVPFGKMWGEYGDAELKKVWGKLSPLAGSSVNADNYLTITLLRAVFGGIEKLPELDRYFETPENPHAAYVHALMMQHLSRFLIGTVQDGLQSAKGKVDSWISPLLSSVMVAAGGGALTPAVFLMNSFGVPSLVSTKIVSSLAWTLSKNIWNNLMGSSAKVLADCTKTDDVDGFQVLTQVSPWAEKVLKAPVKLKKAAERTVKDVSRDVVYVSQELKKVPDAFKKARETVGGPGETFDKLAKAGRNFFGW